MLGITVVFDGTHSQIGNIPLGVRAGYVTGTPDIQWTPEDWQNNPGAIRIDQSPVSTVWDATADVDDYENGAVGLNELAPRAKLRKAAYAAGTRKGQREPLVYMSANNVTSVCNALVAGGVTSGVGLWVANWNLTEPIAIADVLAGSGPFPIRGIQFHNAGSFDISVFETAWINTVSGATVNHHQAPAPPGEWTGLAIMAGLGLDSNLWSTVYDPDTGKWSGVQRAGLLSSCNLQTCGRVLPPPPALGRMCLQHKPRRQTKWARSPLLPTSQTRAAYTTVECGSTSAFR